MARHVFSSDISGFSVKKPKPTEIFADILADFRRNDNNSDANSDSFIQQSLSRETGLSKVIKLSAEAKVVGSRIVVDKSLDQKLNPSQTFGFSSSLSTSQRQDRNTIILGKPLRLYNKTSSNNNASTSMCAPYILNYASIAKMNNEKTAATALASAKAELFSSEAAKHPPPNVCRSQPPQKMHQQNQQLSNDLNNNNNVLFTTNNNNLHNSLLFTNYSQFNPKQQPSSVSVPRQMATSAQQQYLMDPPTSNKNNTMDCWHQSHQVPSLPLPSQHQQTGSINHLMQPYNEVLKKEPMSKGIVGVGGAIVGGNPTANNNNSLNRSMIINGVNLSKLKFVKPAPQCFYWENRRHPMEPSNCRLWHPRELCKYYPKCTLSAEVCGFGHPFCGEYCKCDSKNRSLQKNHRDL